MSIRLHQSLFAALSFVLFSLSSATAGTLETTAGSQPTSANDERFFVVFFAHQSADNEIKSSHTFATFVRTTGASSQLHVAETTTISWLPVSGKIALGRFAEAGVNKSLEATIAWAEERDLQILVNGPFEIQPDLYHRAVRQAARLNGGALKYKVFDGNTRGMAKNCIHALSDIVGDEGLLQSGTLRGQDATLLVVHHFEPFFVSGRVASEAPALLQALNVAQFTQPEHGAMVAAAGDVTP